MSLNPDLHAKHLAQSTMQSDPGDENERHSDEFRADPNYEHHDSSKPVQTWQDGEDTLEGRGHWLETYSGKRFVPLDPRPEDIDLVSIVHALALICRYGGHVEIPYFVSDHSYLMWWQARYVDKMPDGVCRAVLMHDAAEGYIGDLVRSLKMAIKSAYNTVEAPLEAVIEAKYSLPNDEATQRYVKSLDRSIVWHERKLLFPYHDVRNIWAADEYLNLGVEFQLHMERHIGKSHAEREALFMDALFQDATLSEAWSLEHRSLPGKR